MTGPKRPSSSSKRERPIDPPCMQALHAKCCPGGWARRLHASIMFTIQASHISPARGWPLMGQMGGVFRQE